jgi:hypothetical protein
MRSSTRATERGFCSEHVLVPKVWPVGTAPLRHVAQEERLQLSPAKVRDPLPRILRDGPLQVLLSQGDEEVIQAKRDRFRHELAKRIA